MSTTLAAEWHADEPRLRVTEGDARAALRAVGRPVISARARLRFGPGRTCESVARLLDRVIVQAENAGLDPQMLVVADGSAQAAEDIIRVRRKAHGIADWIHSPTCRVTIVLRPAGLYATAGMDVPRAAPVARALRSRCLARRCPRGTGRGARHRRPRGAVRRHRPGPGREHRRPRLRPGRLLRGADRRHHHDPHLRGLPGDGRHGGPDPRRTRPAQRHRTRSGSTGGGYRPGSPPTLPTAAASSCAPSASPSSPPPRPLATPVRRPVAQALGRDIWLAR